MKHLPKHLRPRYRYLGVALESWPDADIQRAEFQNAVWKAARSLFGDPGSAAVGLEVLRFEFTDGCGNCVVRVRHGEVERGRAAIACVSEVSSDPVGVRIRGVSGTVRACEERYIRRPGERSEVKTVAFAGADRRACLRGERADVEVGGGYLGATEHEV